MATRAPRLSFRYWLTHWLTGWKRGRTRRWRLTRWSTHPLTGEALKVNAIVNLLADVEAKVPVYTLTARLTDRGSRDCAKHC